MGKVRYTGNRPKCFPTLGKVLKPGEEIEDDPKKSLLGRSDFEAVSGSKQAKAPQKPGSDNGAGEKEE